MTLQHGNAGYQLALHPVEFRLGNELLPFVAILFLGSSLNSEIGITMAICLNLSWVVQFRLKPLMSLYFVNIYKHFSIRLTSKSGRRFLCNYRENYLA